MTYETTRFGNLEFDSHSVVTFPEGMPGLESYRIFILVHTEETEPIFWLQSLEDADLALPVAQVFELMEDYALDIDDDDLKLLKIEKPDDVLVLTVVVIPEDITQMTANFAAPILIQANAGLGKQVFTTGTFHSVRRPIFDDIMAALARRQADAGLDTQGK